MFYVITRFFHLLYFASDKNVALSPFSGVAAAFYAVLFSLGKLAPKKGASLPVKSNLSHTPEKQAHTAQFLRTAHAA